MVRPTHLGYALLIVGLSIALLSLTIGGGTQRACPSIDSPVYEMVGIQPTETAVTDISLSDGTVEWYDGCNWRTNSLIPLMIGGALSCIGVLAFLSADSNRPEGGN